MHPAPKMRVLAFETSCDETAVAVVDQQNGKFVVRSNVVYSQVLTHAKNGGVVPEVAAREHCIKIVPVLDKAVRLAGATRRNVDAIVVTVGPGLITSLAVGVEAAKTLAAVWKKPLIPVNHIEGHVAANWLQNKVIHFPALCLVVSGGHTELLLLWNLKKPHCIGRTLDDASGEAFDKVAKLLHLGYPGGPAIGKIAQRGNVGAYNLPRPMLAAKNFDFSFAGIKTAVMYIATGVPGNTKLPGRKISKADMAASFQQAVVDVLVGKTVRAAQQYNAKSVLLAGGVAANGELRKQLQAAVERNVPNAEYFQPALEYCGDNAAMIAARGLQLFEKKKTWPWEKPVADPNWEVWGK